jgi:hydroxyacylglutathione hydrolase
MEIVPLRTRKDNYSYLLVPAPGTSSNGTAVVDPGEASPVLAALTERELDLTWILITHHHADHIAGVPELLSSYPEARVICSEHDQRYFESTCHLVSEEKIWQFGELSFQVLATPCHSRGHIIYYFKDQQALFSGDTLFIGGCGRFFEGTAREMDVNFRKICKLPPETKVYCGHEYTLRGLDFCLSIEPSNAETRAKRDAISDRLSQGGFSVPSTIADEQKTNVFLRTESPEVRKTVGDRFGEFQDDPVWILAKLRELKDNA